MSQSSPPDLQDELLIVVVRRASLETDKNGAARVGALRAAALSALSAAARAQGAELGSLKKDERDAPMPNAGWYWSLSHTSSGTRGLAAACVSRSAVGVDAEAVRSASPEVIAAAMSAQERALFRGREDSEAFTRTWIAKEAVLKKLGLGLMALSQVRLEDVDDDACVLEHAGVRHAVEVRAFDAFLVAVAGRARERVDWRCDEGPALEQRA